MAPGELIAILSMTYILLMKLCCFFIGYLIVRIGSGLLRDGISGDFKLNTSLAGFKGDLVSASPGLLFLVIGAVVIGYAMWIPKETRLTAYPAKIEANPPEVALP